MKKTPKRTSIDIPPRALKAALPHDRLESAIYEQNLLRDFEIVPLSDFKDSVVKLLKALHKDGWRYSRPRAGTQN